MTTLNSNLRLYVNGDSPGGANALLQSQTSGNPVTSRPAWMQGDRVVLCVYFRKPNADVGEVTTAYALLSGYSLTVCGKLADDVKDGQELFRSFEWVETGSDDDVHYEATLDLETNAINAAFASSSEDSLDVDIDIEYRDSAGYCVTYRAQISVTRQVYQGTSERQAYRIVSPTGVVYLLWVSDDGQLQVERGPSDVAVPSLSYLLASPSGANFQISVTDDGQLQIERV